ncbi:MULTISPECIES: 2-keto-4-pentenoate hydratase [Paraburkholderia]|jgi:2-keto-4-pentenoate hydratase|uniref:2-keto-4-pentenoate hydratase n=1 Tax=Paraburkholderia madseniana TaxID=2599607 RepID=A0A6N6WAH3_9BURK|nr:MULTISPECIES: 2-keto-4-pentenoate hydratase [Paraburkholderia]KAE8757657.1 2-keto-4-pentenoate hydratase [Paraburkholderia madseniana]MCX4149825.1 2-keto-4-pentenoate hydratase [Paraburkholderia madseniana]MCX4173868.1 2-keto-4-pentenoate hydratase [Paraburkholderia madseniana]MDN7152761.1 2-keto-4-pentenoate hydratase [Paraburkholderia sp. WS6]MDQ6411643.1 2-keto-4-pentenoate hydratase [Paraburkholderia madseniana]
MPDAVHASQRVALWHEKAASILVAARRQGTQVERLPVELRPSTVDEGFAIQRKVSDALESRTGAWKCALPQPGKVIAAPIYDADIHRGDVCRMSGSPRVSVRAEPELACLLNRDLPPRRETYSEAEALDALGHTHLALELLGSRYSHPETLSFPELLADGLFNAGLVIGPRVKSREGATLADLPVEFDVSLASVGEEPVMCAGRHPDRGALQPIVWLVNFLRVRGLGLHAGQAVITGSYAGVLELPVGRELHIGFGDLGTLPITFLS